MTKIVIVDNSVDICKIYQDTLNCAGYSVKSICEEEEAITVIQKEHPDLVLLDILMPKIDGLNLLQMILADKNNKKTRVVIFTNVSDSRIREKAISCGAIDYIIKSQVSMTEVLRRVDRALSV